MQFKKWLLEAEIPEFDRERYEEDIPRNRHGQISFHDLFMQISYSSNSASGIFHRSMRLGIEMSLANCKYVMDYYLNTINNENVPDSLFSLCLNLTQMVEEWLRNSYTYSLGRGVFRKIAEDIRQLIGEHVQNSPFPEDVFYAANAIASLGYAAETAISFYDKRLVHILDDYLYIINLIHESIYNLRNYNGIPFTIEEIHRAIRAELLHNPQLPIETEKHNYNSENIEKIKQLCQQRIWGDDDIFSALNYAQDILGMEVLRSIGNNEKGDPEYYLLLNRFNPIFPRDIHGTMDEIINQINNSNLGNSLIARLKVLICNINYSL